MPPAESPSEPPKKPADRPPAPRDPGVAQPALPPSSASAALGNLFLVIILLSLISIPFLVYFTDTGSRAKREIGRLMRGPASAVPPAGEEELEQSRQRVYELEREVELLLAKLAAAPPPTPAPAATPNPPASASAPAPVPAAPDIPLAPKTLPRQEFDVATLFNGVGVKAVLDLQEGENATRERVDPAAYEFQMTLKLRVPKPNTSIGELSALNPHLPQLLPGLESLLPSATVSPFFATLYDLKHERIKSSLTRLDGLETRHNYFDCETVLDLTHPQSGRKAVLIQGEMDVVADGSDGDRMPTIDDYISLSKYYQPTTSYGWSKKSRTPNPLVPKLESELKEVEAEYSVKGLSPDRNRYLLTRRDELKRLIADLASRSYLIAEADPFIVLPLSIVRHEGTATHRPLIGDYAVVIHGDKAYPAICGDAGPSWKMGEASLLLARTINGEASPYHRPVSDLKVTYVIFPGSREEKNDAPDLVRWTARCAELLNGIGGIGEGFELHAWRDIVAERRAVREIKSVLEDAWTREDAAEAREKAAQTDAAAAGKTVAAAQEALARALKAEPAPAPETLAALEAEVAKLAPRAESAASALATATAARQRAAQAVKEIVTRSEAIKAAADAAYPTPRTQTTDVALAKLEEARKILADLSPPEA